MAYPDVEVIEHVDGRRWMRCRGRIIQAVEKNKLFDDARDIAGNIYRQLKTTKDGAVQLVASALAAPSIETHPNFVAPYDIERGAVLLAILKIATSPLKRLPRKAR